MITKNLTIARESRGLTQKDLCEKVDGLSQGNLSRMEKGLLPVSDDVIKSISRVLNYPISFFSKEIVTTKDDSLFYRKRITMTQRVLSKLEARINIVCSIIDGLLESVDVPELSIPHVEVSGGLSPEQIAFNLRNYLRVPSGPIEGIVSLLEKRGVIVIFMDMGEKFDGVTKFTQRAQPIMCINSRISNDRKRFTIAHELGHLVMHLRSTDFAEDEKIMEYQANAFASEFLMPEVDCKADLRTLNYSKLPSLKMYWGVSKAAIIRRAYDLKCLSESTYRYYLMTLSKTGERKVERELINIRKPVVFKKIIDLHREELGYSEDELTDLLGVHFSEIKSLFDAGSTTRLRVVV